jgi:hypothetical protein
MCIPAQSLLCSGISERSLSISLDPDHADRSPAGPQHLQAKSVIILEGGNLASIFTSTSFDWIGIHADGRHFFGVLFAIVVLPSVWLRDLRVISYISGQTDLSLLHFFLHLFIIY